LRGAWLSRIRIINRREGPHRLRLCLLTGPEVPVQLRIPRLAR
jgi:hypothetical protein